MIALVTRVVDASRRQAPWLVGFILAAVVVIAIAAVRHLGIDTDTGKLFSPTLPWRQAELQLDRAFPQNNDLLAIVIDAPTPDQAQDAAAGLASRLTAKPQLFRDVRQPGGGLFFRKNGLLFLSKTEVQSITDKMVTAQPMLGTLASDPSARGVLNALDLLAQGPLQADTPIAQLDPPFEAVATAVNAALAGRYQPLSWQNLLNGSNDTTSRQIVLAQPALNFGAVQPGQQAIEAIHAIAADTAFAAARGTRVRVTGPVALADDQLAALKEGAGLAAVLSLGLLVFWLALAVRSFRAVCAILITLVSGLIVCVGVAVAFVGKFNPISIAFAPLFIGIAIDFGIQFCVRYAAEREDTPSSSDALHRTAVGLGLPLTVAAAATAVGFLSLYPTDYRGVSDLGLIAGAGMVIALVLNLTLLPALLQLFRARGFKEAHGVAGAGRLDQWLIGHRSRVLLVVAVAVIGSLIALKWLHFDFDPINLENPAAESVQTVFDLMKDPQTTPYTLDVLTPSSSAASALAAKLNALPEVSQVIWIGSFVPSDQPAKLEIIADTRELLEPTLSPPVVKPAPAPQEILDAAKKCADDLSKLGEHGDRTSNALGEALKAAVARGVSIVPLLDSNISQGVGNRLDDMRLVLQAAPVSFESLPADLKQDWIAADGRHRVQAFPKGNARDTATLLKFVTAVRSVAPDASGTPVGIQESGRTVVRAFAIAGVIAVVMITLLLALVLRNVRAIAAVLGPLLLAGLLTLATCAAFGMSLNFANIVTLPLLLGIGVAFDIYFVLRWRAGEPGLLGSPTARAIVFSALTTGTAFGSLAISKSPGMADMGKLLSVGLFYTLLCTLLLLPALLGNAPTVRPPADSA